MPQGVVSDFLRILQEDRSAALSRSIVMAVLALLLFGVAWFVAELWGVVAHGAGVAVGLGVGLLWGQRTVGRYAASLQGTWNTWMRKAPACESVPEVHRKVRDKRGRHLPFLYALVLLVVWALEVALFALAFVDDASLWAQLPVLAVNGLLAGGLAGFFLRTRAWFRSFQHSVQEMLADGELGVWGER